MSALLLLELRNGAITTPRVAVQGSLFHRPLSLSFFPSMLSLVQTDVNPFGFFCITNSACIPFSPFWAFCVADTFERVIVMGNSW